MSKIFTFLFVFFILAYVFILSRLQPSNFPNAVNQNLRPVLLKSGLARQVFFLDRPGDARFNYASAGKRNLLIEIDYQTGRSPDAEINQWLRQLVEETLRKEVEIHSKEEKGIPDKNEFSDVELRELLKVTRDYFPKEGQSYIHIIYVSASEKAVTNTGLNLSSEDLFIFKDAIYSLSDISRIRARVEHSTIVHEFGHLLGLEHIDDDDCVMSERVEVYPDRKYQIENIPLEFCKESLSELNRLKGDAFLPNN